MHQKLYVEEFETPQHAELHAALNKISLSLHRLNVSLMIRAVEAPEERRKTIRVVSAHVLSSLNTLASILSLTDKLSLKVKEAIALSRVFYETSLVAAFTCVGGNERAYRAELYSVYKMFRTQTQVQNVGQLVLRMDRGSRLSRKDPRVVDAMKVFGGSSGIRPCFVESRQEMLAEVALFDSASGLFLGGVEGMIHDISSEIIHGSLYGYDLFSSLQNGRAEVIDNLNAHHEMVCFSVILCIAAMSRIIGKSFDLTRDAGELESSCISSVLTYLPDDLAAQFRV